MYITNNILPLFSFIRLSVLSHITLEYTVKAAMLYIVTLMSLNGLNMIHRLKMYK